MRCIIASILLAGIFALLGGFAVIYTGTYDVAATSPHWPVTRWLMETARSRSIKAHAAGIQGAPGVKAAEFAEGMNPHPPDIDGPVVQHYSDAELVWIVKNGIKMSGMPAWADHSDEEVWATVAFLQKLPGMSEQDYARLVMANMAHGAQHHHGGGDEGRPGQTPPDGHEHH